MGCPIEEIKENSLKKAKKEFIDGSTMFRQEKDGSLYIGTTYKLSISKIDEIIQKHTFKVKQWASNTFGENFSKNWVIATNVFNTGFSISFSFPKNLEEAYEIKIEKEKLEKEARSLQEQDAKRSGIDYDDKYLFQKTGRDLSTISKEEISNLQSTVDYELLNVKNEELLKKGGQSYIFLNEKDAKRFSFLIEKHKEFPKIFRVSSKVTKYEKDKENALKYNSYNVYRDFNYVKANNNKKSNLYNIVDIETGEIIATKVRVLDVSKDAKSKIASKYGLEFTPTQIFSANRSIAFALYRQKPSKAKYIAQAKKYLYDAIKFLNPEESNLKINLDQIEKLLESFPNDMWDYINTTYSPENSTNINASIGLQNTIKFKLPKLGLLTEIEKITGKKLQSTSFKNYDRSGGIKKVLRVEWGEVVVIDYKTMTTKQLRKAISYYLKSTNYFKPTSEEENVRKYAEHKGIDYNELRELVFGDLDKALDNISYNTTGNSDSIELSKWRESIREYDWQSAELFSKPYEDFLKTAKERITNKFKDKNLSNGISHIDYFFSGGFNWLNINFNNISGQYYMSDMETEANVGVETKMGGIINPFEMKIYQKPKAGENFLQEKEVFDRLAAILHEPFHALHALSYGTKEEIELRKAFDNLYKTNFGKEMMNQVFGSGYNQGQKISYDTLYKEFTAFATQLMLYPKEWIQKTDLRSNDIYDFIQKVQTLQDKTYEEIVITQQKIGTTEKTITEEEQIKLTFLEKLYNYLVSALNKIIPLSKKFFDVIVNSKLVEKKVIEDVFGTTEKTVTKTLKLPENVKKSKEEFLQAMDEFKSAINTLMQIDSQAFSSENINNFFTSDKQYQETGRTVQAIKPGVRELFESNPELATTGTLKQYSQYLDTIFPDSKVKDIVYHGTDFGKDSVDFKTDRNGIFLASTSIYASYFSKEDNAFPALVNFKNSYQAKQLTDNIGKDEIAILKSKGYDSVIGKGGISKMKQHQDDLEFIAFNPTQVHILGSEQDIEGFKEFVKSNSTQEIKSEEIETNYKNFINLKPSSSLTEEDWNELTPEEKEMLINQTKNC